MSETPKLILSPGPHIHAELSTPQIMWWVSASLLPAFLWATYIFGLRVVALTISGIVGAMLGEWLVNKLQNRKQTLFDGSAALTGALLVGTLSPGLPLWMPALGGLLGIIFAKMLFGGLGYNIFNPALIGRAILMASFPLAMTTTWLKAQAGVLLPPDVVTHATPLNVLKLEGVGKLTEMLGTGWHFYQQLFFGMKSGSIGEVSCFFILLGAVILLWKGIIKLYIPLSVFFGLFLVTFFSGLPLFHLVSGGVWLGAFYMATDYVTAPMDSKAQIIFGTMIGMLTGIIRVWGGYPEGICYAILIVNAITPALNQWFKPKRPAWQGVPS